MIVIVYLSPFDSVPFFYQFLHVIFSSIVLHAKMLFLANIVVFLAKIATFFYITCYLLHTLHIISKLSKL